jgi:spermatogenesis-associated protein 2
LRKNSERQQENHRLQSQPRNYIASLQKAESQQLASGKTREDGTGAFESWDYVFRNLESQGYSKDLGERPDILSPSPERMAGNSVSHRNHLEDIKNCHQHHQQQPPVKDLEDTLMELRLEEFHKALPAEHRPLKINEALQKIRMETDSEPCNRVPLGNRSPTIDAMDGSGSVYDNMSSPPKDIPDRGRPVTVSTAASKSNSNFSARNNKTSTRTLPRDTRRYGEERDRSSSQAGTHYSSTTLDPRNLQSSTNHYQITTNISDSTAPEQNVTVGESSSRVRIDDRQESTGGTSLDIVRKSSEVSDKNKWECVTCTFLNVPSRDVCEMCGKSKMRGPEVRPLASGGRECPQCTLVNEKGVGTCEACGSSLKDSPTYI